MTVSQEMRENLEEMRGLIEARLADALTGSDVSHDELTLTVKRESLLDTMRVLHDDTSLQFWSIVDLCGVDYPERDARFEVVYHLLSPRQNARLRVKLSTDAETPVPSITGIYPGADWYEREAYDLYGI
ncbi:MAG: NADH-quinone oxidoreductase subunit C, partial [Pseudomonadota bacterium]|nr:NADH-quinone oxidoreductase subunit C [Pseudomonadota bacterium]